MNKQEEYCKFMLKFAPYHFFKDGVKMSKGMHVEGVFGILWALGEKNLDWLSLEVISPEFIPDTLPGVTIELRKDYTNVDGSKHEQELVDELIRGRAVTFSRRMKELTDGDGNVKMPFNVFVETLVAFGGVIHDDYKSIMFEYKNHGK